MKKVKTKENIEELSRRLRIFNFTKLEEIIKKTSCDLYEILSNTSGDDLGGGRGGDDLGGGRGGDDCSFLREKVKNKINIGKLFSEKFKDLFGNLELHPSGEFFKTIILDKYTSYDKKLFDKYFTLKGDKVGSRGLGYYGLFGTGYDINTGDPMWKKNINNYMETFWKDYDEYISFLSYIKNKEDFYIHYLDNYRNFLLVWINVLILILQYDSIGKTRKKILLDEEGELLIEKNVYEFVDKYIKILNLILDYLVNDNLNELPDITNIYDNIKDIFFNKQICMNPNKKERKKGINWTLYDVFTKKYYDDFHNKIFRNYREEDNLGAIFGFFLQLADEDILKINNKSEISILLNKIKNMPKKDYIISPLYGGIEFALLAKYLGYKSGLILYSIYHLKNAGTDKDIRGIFFDLYGEPVKYNQSVMLVDDNTLTGRTLRDITIIINNGLSRINQFIGGKYNHILKEIKQTFQVKKIGTLRLYLSSNERKGKLDCNNLLGSIKDENLPECKNNKSSIFQKKQLISHFLYPYQAVTNYRNKKKNGKFGKKNIFLEWKERQLRKFGKRFRSQ